MRLATLCLASCSGCHINLLSLHDEFLDLLAANDLVFSPILMDEKEPQACDLALIEGAVRTEEDAEKLRALRAKAQLLVAMGSCAVYGGIVGLGNAYENHELLKPAYENHPETTNHLALIPRARPIDAVVPVDYYLPGCPPPPQVIESFLNNLLTEQPPAVIDLPVCAECGRTVRGEIPLEIKRTYQDPVAPDECLLQQGFMCLGSVTRAGCDAPCTKAGTPCLGCRGPAHRLMVDASHGIFEDWVRRRCHYTKLSPKEVERSLDHLKHTLYLYTLASPFMRMKRSERVAELVYRVNWDQEMPPAAESQESGE